ncbi:hypothetical protein RDWZM_004117 [Blomia tropicalis]|uniref:Uncharacterized protein n=1 Tax=Blomia tropicalis TaxID=40697 RepID=A0A9Q0MJG6_BLOTA|nr:hypothetical protein RDWZM_004117 [Blomia tropicalis]
MIRVVYADDSHLIEIEITNSTKMMSETEETSSAEVTIKMDTLFTENAATILFDSINPIYLIAKYYFNEMEKDNIKYQTNVSFTENPFKLSYISPELVYNGTAENIIYGPVMFHYDSDFKINVKPKMKTMIYFYLMFCYIPKGYYHSCHIIFEHDNSTRCLCLLNGFEQFKHIFILILCLIQWFISFWYGKSTRIRLLTNNDPEQQHLMICCTQKNSRYRYLIIFRVGCPSRTFNMTNSYIDIELLSDVTVNNGKQRELIGYPIRFVTNRLTDIICSEMRCVVFKMTPIGFIHSIRVSHSDRTLVDDTTINHNNKEHGKVRKTIYLYDFTVTQLDSFDEQYSQSEHVIQEAEVNRHITSKPTDISLKPFDKTKTRITSTTTTQTYVSIGTNSDRSMLPLNTSSKVEMKEYPILPIQPLNGLESTIIIQLGVFYGGAMSMFLYLMPYDTILWRAFYIEKISKLIPFISPSDNMCGCLLIALITLIFIFMIIYSLAYIYKDIIKRYYFKQKHLQGSHLILWSFVMDCSMILMILCSLALTVYIFCTIVLLVLLGTMGCLANPVATGGAVGPHGGGFTGGFAVGRSIAVGPGGKVTSGGFGPFFGGIPFFFRR